jgi:protein-S-isoprenylcysteine O-methyltransferase Ste14
MRRLMYVAGALAGGWIGAQLVLKGPSAHRLPLFTAGPNRWFSLDQEVHAHWTIFAACAVLWVLFGLYWEIAAKSASAAESTESQWSRSIHVGLVNIAQLFVLLPITGLGRLYPGYASVMVAGITVQVAGTALAIWARVHLGKHWSGKIAIKVDHELVKTGPYRRLRHPIYTGLLAMYLGAAIVTGERLGVLGVAIAIFAYWRKIQLEEAAIAVAFGKEYADYLQSTWALVPGLY